MDDEVRRALQDANPPSPFMSEAELKELGFTKIGRNSKISRKCSFYNVRGTIGANVRIDDFCILKGHIDLYDYVHLAAYCMVSGAHAPVTIREFVGVAAYTNILSGSDDYRANTLGNPCTPAECTTIITGPVHIGIGTVVGSHCVILPRVTIGDAASIGSGCVVAKDVQPGGMLRSSAPILLNRVRDVQAIKKMALQILENDDREA